MTQEAAGTTSEVELRLLLQGIVECYGYDFRNYARASLRRRVRAAMKREGVPTISALQERVLHDPRAMSRFVASISVHVTAMFRDPSFYLTVRHELVPLLRTYPFVRIWHAGCATGEEVLSLAIVLHEAGLYERCLIYATDISDELVDRAARGVYPLNAMRQYTQNYLRSGGTGEFSDYYFADSKHVLFRDWLRTNVVYSRHNLVSDGSFNEFQLILCRNVMIYFDRELRSRVHRLFLASLTQFGVLALGLKESLDYSEVGGHFEPLSEEQRVYRRIR